MSRVLGMKDPRCASYFLSNTVGNQIKGNVDDVKVRVKSKLTIFILLAHIAIFVVNNSSMQVNPQKKIVWKKKSLTTPLQLSVFILNETPTLLHPINSQ